MRYFAHFHCLLEKNLIINKIERIKIRMKSIAMKNVLQKFP